MASIDNVTYVGLNDFVAKRNENGDLIVVGKATGEDLDLDRQICDGEWLAKAVPAWFRSGANVREQHSNIAAGIGLEIENDGTDWYLKSEVVDPVSAKKVERGVLKGYSIGIKDAKVIKDASAPGGRIVGGSIVEISLVDRPANPTARIEIAKAVDGGSLELVKSDDVTYVSHPGAKDADDKYPAELPCPGCNGLGKVSDNPGVIEETCAVCDGTGFAPEGLRASNERFGNPVDDENHEIKSTTPDVPEEVIAEGEKQNSEEALPVDEAKSVEGDVEKKEYSDEQRAAMEESGAAMEGGGFPIKTVADLKNAIQSIGRAKDRAATVAHIKARAKALGREDLIPDTFKAIEHDEATLNSVRAGLVALMKAELDEMLSGEENEICDVKELLCALELFLCWWDSEADEGETVEPFMKEEESDEMAYVNLGVSAEIIKAANAPEATAEEKDALRVELRKALGVEDEIIITKSHLEAQEEVLKSLKAELEAIKEMASPGGPALRQTASQIQKTAEVERLTAEAGRYRQLASDITNPTTKQLYLAKALEYEAAARKI